MIHSRLSALSWRLRQILWLLAVLATALLLPCSTTLAGAEASPWTTTGSMSTARAGETATLLLDGRVLVAGGFNLASGTVATAELYDPRTGTWRKTGSMKEARDFHTATLLPNGKVLVAGGYNSERDVDLKTAELYDPHTGVWSSTGSMHDARDTYTATLLSNGTVLVAGGFPNHTDALASAELYDPRDGTWRGTGSMVMPRAAHTATLLPDGKVLVAGGCDSGDCPASAVASAELYTPRIGRWNSTGSMKDARALHTATLVSASGSRSTDRHEQSAAVLVAGGANRASGVLTMAELYDLKTGTWHATSPMGTARADQTATALPDGLVLVVGGIDATSTGQATAELYHPQTGSWTGAGMMREGRAIHTATLLTGEADTAYAGADTSATVLVAGGVTDFNTLTPLSSAELYTPSRGGGTSKP